MSVEGGREREERGKGSGRPNPRYGLERLQLCYSQLELKHCVCRRKRRDTCGLRPIRQQMKKRFVFVSPGGVGGESSEKLEFDDSLN